MPPSQEVVDSGVFLGGLAHDFELATATAAAATETAAPTSLAGIALMGAS